MLDANNIILGWLRPVALAVPFLREVCGAVKAWEPLTPEVKTSVQQVVLLFAENETIPCLKTLLRISGLAVPCNNQSFVLSTQTPDCGGPPNRPPEFFQDHALGQYI